MPAMDRFHALSYPGEVVTRFLADGTLERCYRVWIGREQLEYRDAIGKADIHAVHGRVGVLRHRAIVRHIESVMRARRIGARPTP
jgi:hypothetical protein